MKSTIISVKIKQNVSSLIA